MKLSILDKGAVCGTEGFCPWGFSPEARRGSQGASRAAPGKSGLHARGEGVCPTLWDPVDSSPPGSPVPGILHPVTTSHVCGEPPLPTSIPCGFCGLGRTSHHAHSRDSVGSRLGI